MGAGELDFATGLCGAVGVMTHELSALGKLCIEHLPRFLGNVPCQIHPDTGVITIKSTNPRLGDILVVDDGDELTIYFGDEGHVHIQGWHESFLEDGDDETPESFNIDAVEQASYWILDHLAVKRSGY